MNTDYNTDTCSHKKSGWHALVNLEFINRFGKSVLGECSRKGPLTFQRPFYPEKNVCHLYLLHPPGGVVGGDRIDLNISVKENAHSLITTPGATKFYRSQGLTARQQQRFNVKPTGILEWFPQETILFPGAKADISTRIDLDDNAIFIGWDILCLGRPASQMSFHTGTLKTRFCIYKKGIPLYIDHLTIDNEMGAKTLCQSSPGLQNFPVSAVFMATGMDPNIQFDPDFDQKLSLNLDLDSNINFGLETECNPDRENKAPSLKGVTQINDILIARYLGHDPEEAKAYFIYLWKIIRQDILNIPYCIPRIWAT